MPSELVIDPAVLAEIHAAVGRPVPSIDSVYTLPPGRWGELVCGAEEGSVSAEEVLTVFRCIERRLAFQPSTQTPSPRPQADTLARLTSSEGRSSAPSLPLDGIAFSEVIAGITTVGQLHEAIEAHFGEAGWKALTACWCEAAGIEQPTRASAIITNRTLDQKVTPGLPSSPSLSPENEARAIASLPGAVRRFWLYEPRVPPWRRQETVGEQEWREDREGDGAWAGW